MPRKLAYAFSLYIGILHVCYLRAACVVILRDLINLRVRIIKFIFFRMRLILIGGIIM